MEHLNFSPKTRSLLEAAGWSDSREIDTTGYEKTLRERSYPVHPSVLEFLSRFGGLIVIHPHARVPGMQDRFHFDASRAAESVFPAWVKEYSARLNAPLCVVGQAYREYMVVMMDPQGRMFAGYDHILVELGTSFVEAIENICAGKQHPRIP
jgi:hypothetical protein